MSENPDPTKPTTNQEKFKPQNVADEGAGKTGAGRLDREMNGTNTARGSEPETRNSSNRRG